MDGVFRIRRIRSMHLWKCFIRIRKSTKNWKCGLCIRTNQVEIPLLYDGVHFSEKGHKNMAEYLKQIIVNESEDMS